MGILGISHIATGKKRKRPSNTNPKGFFSLRSSFPELFLCSYIILISLYFYFFSFKLLINNKTNISTKILSKNPIFFLKNNKKSLFFTNIYVFNPPINSTIHVPDHNPKPIPLPSPQPFSSLPQPQFSPAEFHEPLH